jgi:trigger factor
MDPKQLDQQFVQMIYAQMRPQAELDVRGSMLLEKVAEIEQVVVTDEDVEGELVKISAYYRMPTEEIRKALAADGGVDNIKRQLKTKKTIEAIVAHAVITDEPWVEESEEPVPVDMEKKLAKAEESAG